MTGLSSDQILLGLGLIEGPVSRVRRSKPDLGVVGPYLDSEVVFDPGLTARN